MSSQHQPPDNWICLGRIIDAHGIKGDLRIQSFTQDPKHIGAYGPLKLIGCEDCVTVLKVRHQKKDMVIIRAKEVVDRDTAELLRGQRLYIDKSNLPKLSEDADIFYISDLEGLDLIDKAHKPIGRIEAIHNYGAGDILEITLMNQNDSVMIPFLKEWILDVNLDSGRAMIDQVYLAEYLKAFKPSDEKWDEIAVSKDISLKQDAPNQDEGETS